MPSSKNKKKAPPKKVSRPRVPEPPPHDDDDEPPVSSNGHARRAPVVAETPFTVPFRWVDTAAAEFQSQDGAVTMFTIQRASGEARLVIDAGEYADSEGAKLVGELVMRLLVDGHGMARLLTGDLAEVLALVLDNWELIDGERLRGVIMGLIGDEPRTLRLEATDVLETRDE